MPVCVCVALHAVATNAVPRSLIEVYGDPEEHPQKETYWGHVNPIGPRACYDEGKRVAETMMYAYQAQVKRKRSFVFVAFTGMMLNVFCDANTEPDSAAGSLCISEVLKSLRFQLAWQFVCLTYHDEGVRSPLGE